VKRILILAIAVFVFVSAPVSANPIGKAWHWVDTHKELLAANALVVASFSADAASTRYTEAHCPRCIETNPLLPGRPSSAEVWGVSAGYSVTVVTLNSLAWHYAPNKTIRHIVWYFTAPVVANEAVYTIPNNVRAAGR